MMLLVLNSRALAFHVTNYEYRNASFEDRITKDLMIIQSYFIILKTTPTLTQLHSEWLKLHRVLAVLSAVGLNRYTSLH